MSDISLTGGGAGVPANTINPRALAAYPPGTPVYFVADGDGHVVAKAAFATTQDASTVVGVTAQQSAIDEKVFTRIVGPLVLTTDEWDAQVTGQSGGLTNGKQYFLSETAGKLTLTRPSGGAGHYICPVGVAASSTCLMVNPGLSNVSLS